MVPYELITMSPTPQKISLISNYDQLMKSPKFLWQFSGFVRRSSAAFLKSLVTWIFKNFCFPKFLLSLPVKTLFDWSSWLLLLKRQSLAIRFHTIWFPASLLSLSINYLSIWSWSAAVDWEGLGDETCNWGWGDCGLHNAALTVVPYHNKN